MRLFERGSDNPETEALKEVEMLHKLNTNGLFSVGTSVLIKDTFKINTQVPNFKLSSWIIQTLGLKIDSRNTMKALTTKYSSPVSIWKSSKREES